MKTEKKLTGYPSIDKPWQKYYSNEAMNGELPKCTIYEFLWENNKNFPNDIAINYYGRLITYREMFAQIDRTASAFLALDVKLGEYVTVALPSIPEALYVVYALNKIGAVANMIHPLAGESETVNYLNEVQSRVAVLYDGGFSYLTNSISQTSVKHAVIVSAGCSLLPEMKKAFSEQNPGLTISEESPFILWDNFLKNGHGIYPLWTKKDICTTAIMSHTGGTTGEPKAVMCSDYSVNAMVWQMAHTIPVMRQESQMAVLPPYVNYSLVSSMIEPIAQGCTVILVPDFKPEKFAEYARKYKPVFISSIPPYWEILLSLEEIRSADLSCLRYPIYGGEAMSTEREEAVNQLLLSCGAPNKLGKGLGATEVVSAATLTPYNVPNNYSKLGSAGVPLPKTNCAIVDPDTNEELTYNTEGEICFAGPTVMIGYYNNQEATDDIVKIHDDGQRWLHTGDLGYIDEDGTVFVTGRIKRLMITRGKDGISAKMYPDRIEKAAYKHSSVQLCCAIGVPDPKRNLIPKLFVVLKPDIVASNELTDEIIEICKLELPNYMVPESIEYRTELPRTPRGKIDYRALEK
ncbi:MAG: acyl--CoA ligase [Clostridia bacterium]|nr:acyl--CoA ligase [Clostridia bacterium]